MDNDLYIEHRDVSSIDEGIEIGEAHPSMTYHVLVRRKKHALISHYFWQKCKFCDMEDAEGVVYL
jgi:hypothetical protein